MKSIQALLDKTVKNKHLFGISLFVKHQGQDWCGVSGNFSMETPYFIASTTKLFVSALIFKLRAAGRLNLEDKITKYFSSEILSGLHRYKGQDWTDQITVTNLLAHNSGLPDYFQKKPPGKPSLETRLMSGKDLKWHFEQVIEWSKEMTPLFEPGKPKKAHYSDTNYQLLGKILEEIYHKDLADIIQEEICQPLGLTKTYLYTDPADDTPKPLYFKDKPLPIPKAMTSFWADGGVVSTSSEMMVFLEAFMTGKIFPQTYLSEIQQWRKIFFPLESGIGIHRFKTPWFFSPFRRIPVLIGHSGLSGAFAFYAPEKDIYLSGTVNQIHNPGNSFRLMIFTIIELLKASK